jgi:F0F1-type ATP synthase delta subunit
MQPLIRRYTTLLQRAIQGGSGEDFAKKFIAYLAKRKHLGLLPAILARLTKLGVQGQGAIVTVARVEDAKKFANVIASELSSLNSDAGTYTVKVDDRAVGGYAVRGKGRLVDRTYRSALVSLYQKITH